MFTMVFEAAASGRNRCQDILDDVQLALDREQERLDREERDSDFRWFDTRFSLDREQERMDRELLRLDAAGLVAGALQTGQAPPQLDATRLSSVLWKIISTLTNRSRCRGRPSADLVANFGWPKLHIYLRLRKRWATPR